MDSFHVISEAELEQYVLRENVKLDAQTAREENMGEQKIAENLLQLSASGYGYSCKRCRRPFYSIKSFHKHLRACIGMGPQPEARPASRSAVQLSLADFREGMMVRQ